MPSVLSHVSLGTNDFDRAKAFYDAVLATLGIRCLMAFPGGAGYGQDDGPPGYRKEYTENYYAAFARDLDGNKIEALVFT